MKFLGISIARRDLIGGLWFTTHYIAPFIGFTIMLGACLYFMLPLVYVSDEK